MTHDFEPGIGQQISEIGPGAGVEVVDDKDLVSLSK